MHLGYDPARYHQGFEDLESIFQYVSGSAYFNRSIFLLENRNYQSRVRDRKRKTYTEFLLWCERHAGLPAFNYPAQKSDWLPALFKSFPHFETDYRQALADLATQRELKTRFNGEMVSALTGLTGKELGGLMKAFKESFDSPQAMKDWVLDAPADVLRARILVTLKQLNCA